MAKPLVKINIDLSKVGFKIAEKNGKKFVFAEITDDMVIDETNIPKIKLVGWELPTKKGTAPLKIDYGEGKNYKGQEQYPPTIGWCNVELGGYVNSQPTGEPNPTSPIETDDLPF